MSIGQSRSLPGLALSLRALHGVTAEGRAWSRPLAPAGDGEWPALRDALADASADLVGRGRRVGVALLSPLAQLRWIQLPRLSDEELARVLERDAARHFPGVLSPQVVGFEQPAKRGGPVMVAVAPAWLLDVLTAAAGESGWRAEPVVAAPGAWAAAARAGWSPLARGRGALVVAMDERVEVLGLERGRLVSLRRFPAVPFDAAAIAAAVGALDGPAALVGPPAMRGPLAEALAVEGVQALDPAATDPLADDAAALAAAFAPEATGPVLLGGAARERGRLRTRRAAVALLIAAAVLTVAAAGLEMWGALRERDAVAARRAMIRDEVGRILTVQEALAGFGGRLGAIAELDGTAPRWSEAIAVAGSALPRDAHLSNLRAHGDTLEMEGVAHRAAGVFESLRAAPGLADVRPAAPIRREAREGQGPAERFALIARVPSASPSEVP